MKVSPRLKVQLDARVAAKNHSVDDNLGLEF